MICSNCGKDAGSSYAKRDNLFLCIKCYAAEVNPAKEENEETKPNLLLCPDCGRDVSKRANACLNCGCPIEAIIADQDKVKEQIQNEEKNEKKINYNTFDGLKCPHCGSNNYNKISLKNKIGAGAIFGPFAIVHAGKTFKCKSCGFKW